MFPSQIDRLKFATVRPLFKKGDKRDISNYRPISLLPVFSKILDRVMQTIVEGMHHEAL